MLAQYARKTVSGNGGVSWTGGAHCELPRVVVRGAATQAKSTGKNLFDISALTPTPVSSRAWISEVGDNYLVISEPDGYISNGSATAVQRFNVLAPLVQAGKTYVISFLREHQGVTNGGYDQIPNFYLAEGSGSWYSGTAKTISSADLTAQVVFYGYNSGVAGLPTRDARVSNIQIEEGTAATAYEPYTGGVPAPSLSHPIMPEFAGAVTLEDAAGGTVTLPALLAIPDTEVADTSEYLGGESWRITRHVGTISSYAGEAVGDVWCSSTGELSDGASVWYELASPTTETLALGRLVQPKGAGSIEQTAGSLDCPITVEYIAHS